MMAEMMETNDDKQCQLCLREGGVSLKDLIAAESLLERPPTIPQNIWCDKAWWIMCLICFTNWLTNRPPEVNEEEEDIEIEMDLSDCEDWDD